MSVLTNLGTEGKLYCYVWSCVVVFLSLTAETIFCTDNATEEGCESCELTDLAAKHKLYNWLVLSVVLLLLVLLLILVGFLCYRMWPRDHSPLERAVFRYNLEQEQHRVLTDISSSRTSRGEQEL